MEEKNNPLSPHLQIYRWQISSLLSITHRIVGVINIIAITIICFWSLSLLLGAESYLIINNFFQSLAFQQNDHILYCIINFDTEVKIAPFLLSDLTIL